MKPLRYRLGLAPWLLAAALSALPGLANAGFTVYRTASAFDAAVRGAGTDDFDDLTPGATVDTPLARRAGALGYSVSVDPDTGFVGAGSPVPPGLVFGAGSAGDAWLSTNSATDTLRLFNLGGVRAIGGQFFGTDVDGAFASAATLVLLATDSAGSQSFTLPDPAASDFFGLVSDSRLVSLSLTALQPAGGSTWVSANNLLLANPVPEPHSLALVLLALLGLAGSARQRRSPRACA